MLQEFRRTRPRFVTPVQPAAVSPLGHPLLLAAKRAIDVVGSLALIVTLLPVLAALALAVRLSSPGPIFFRWNDVGRGGRPFVGYKFRTMVQDADLRKADLLSRNEMEGPVFKIRNDPRITSIGRFLRRHSLDGLPQLWSVLTGDMSLVGPRPPLQTEYERFTPWQRQKMVVTPGMTCLWQVRGRNDISSFDDWVRLDLEYIERWSLLLDLKILLRTAAVVVTARGAA